MPKARVTRRWIAQNYKCVSVGYCDLCDLLQFHNAQYYTSGIYGWNFDCYTFYIHGVNYAITTGYRGMIDNCINNQKPSLDKEYNDKAIEILDNYDLSLEKMEEEVEILLTEYLYKVFNIKH